MRYVGLIALVSLMVAGVTAAQEGGASRPAALDYAFYKAHVIDPATQKVVGEIH